MAGQSVFKFLNILGSCKYLTNVRLPPLYYLPAAGMKQDTKNLINSLNIPERPKKPLTPYFRYAQDARATIQKEHPEYKPLEVAKKLGEQWKSLDALRKSKYEKGYKEELEEYAKKIMEYQTKLSEEQKDALKQVRDEKRKLKDKRLQKQFYKETNKPKRPIGAYMLFSIEQSKKLKKRPVEASKEIKQLWDALSESEKTKYKNQYEETKKQYEIEMAKWETKMIEQGNPEMVRTASRIITKPPSLVQTRKSAKNKKPE